MDSPLSQFPHPTLPSPGAVLDRNGCTFAVHSSTAEQVWLCLFDAEEKETDRIPLRHKAGSLWFDRVEGIKPGQLYGFRVRHKPATVSPYAEYLGPEKLLIDPYARRLNRGFDWHPSLAARGKAAEDTAAILPKAVVSQETFDWEGIERPQIPALNRVIYELHIKGFTALHPEVPEVLRGKYLGLCEPAVVAYLKSLNITTVQLMPCMAFLSEPRLKALGLSNYWGYNPYQFFMPDWRYAIEDPIREFKTLVKTLHQAGLEVILDVVYNHTAEGALEDGVISFRGLDPLRYYRHKGTHLINYSGCGNSLRSEHPQARRLILDSLRYWYEDMQLDGFRFDLAASLGREKESFDEVYFRRNSTLLGAIDQDPSLRHALLVAEPWDIGPDGYQLGSFPCQWLEVNDRFRDTVKAFWRGDQVGMDDFATRLMGSRDLFSREDRPMICSVNNITYHDGFTLDDLVSYRRRHNEANGENGRDGHGHNISCNHGEEGSSSHPGVLASRLQHKRNLFGTLILSRGTPHMLAGDERSRTQAGNNNAYCQDNPVSWMDWSPLNDYQQAFFHFAQLALWLRQQYGSINHLALPDETWFSIKETHHVSWLNERGKPMTPAQWQSPKHRFLALLLGENEPDNRDAHHWLIIVNGSQQSEHLRLPEPWRTMHWDKVLDSLDGNDNYLEQTAEAPADRREAAASISAPGNSMSLWHAGPMLRKPSL